MTKRLAFFMPDLNGGGAERSALVLLPEFARRGYAADLVVLRRTGALLDDVPPGVRLVALDVRQHRRDYIAGTLAFARYLGAERPDAIISAMPVINLIAVLGRRLARSRARLVTTDRNQPRGAYALEGGRRAQILPRLVRWLYPLADLNGAVSDGVRRELAEVMGRPPETLRTFYNPRDIAPQGAATPPAHPWLRDKDGHKVILAAGRFAEQKDYPTLLAAFARLAATRADLRLIIYGQGGLMTAIQALARDLGVADRVAFPGFTLGVRAEMAAADLFVLSSTREGLPGVLIEALAEGVPVVSTDCPHGPREILMDGALGALVPVRDPDALARAMEAALDAPRPPRPDAALQRFSIAGATDAYEAALFG